MNSYSLSSTSRRWWWLPATAGAVGTAAITAILVVPTTGAATPIDTRTHGFDGTGLTEPVTVVERPCYLAHRDWGTVAGWEQPICTTEIGLRPDDPTTGIRRVAPEDYLP